MAIGHRLLAAAFAAALLPPALRADTAQEHRPDRNTYLLMHFNGDLRPQGTDDAASASFFGSAAFAADGWRGAALDPGTGGVTVAMTRPYEPPYGRIVLEARVFLKRYPAGRGCIVEKVWRNGRNAGASLFVDAEGRVGVEIRPLRGGRRVFMAASDRRVPVGAWTHIVAVVAPWPVQKFRIYLDDVLIHDALAEHGHSLFRSGDRETEGGPIVIGNGEKGGAPFPGLLDEVRIYAEYLELFPPEQADWTDPEARRPFPGGPPFFLPGTAPLVRLSCDAADGGRANGGRAEAKVSGGTLAPGVRGSAISGADIELAADGLLAGKEGTVEFWMMPENWSSEDSRGRALFRMRPETFTFYVFNSPGDDKPLALYYKDDDGKNAFIRFDKRLRPGTWYHFVVAWREGTFRVYCNGEEMVRNRPAKARNLLRARFARVSFPGAGNRETGNKTSRFDEILLYPRALAPGEAWNAYARCRFPARLEKDPLPYATAVRQYPGIREVCATADFLGNPPPARMELRLSGSGREESGSVAVGGAETATVAVPTAALPPGDFTAEIRFRDAAGTLLSARAERLVKKEYPWLGNRIGVPSKVPAPWTPVAVAGTKARMLLSEYSFGRGLLEQSVTDGRPLLAAEVSVEGAADGAPLPPAALRTIEPLPGGLGARLRFESAAGPLRTAADAVLDFDGFIRYELRVVNPGPETRLSSLKIRIPLAPDEATDCYVLGDRLDHREMRVPPDGGVFWSSADAKLQRRREVAEYGAWPRGPDDRPYNFLPYAWIGNHRRGICWMADDDRRWALDPAVGAVTFERTTVAGRPAVCLVLNVAAKPVAIPAGGGYGPIVFGLMATPSKRPPDGWRRAKSESFSVYSKAGRVIGNAPFLVPYPADFDLSRSYVAAGGGRGDKTTAQLPYMDFVSTDFRMEPFPDFRWEWLPAVQTADTSGLNRCGAPCYGTGSLIDWYLWKFNEWVERCDVDGLYVDDVYPRRSPDLRTGQDREGPYQLFAQRELFKRVYCLLEAKGKSHPYIMAHMTHTMIGPAMSFASLALEGEDFYRLPEGKDHMDCWPNDYMSVVDNAALWGVGVQWLVSRREKTGWRGFLAQLLLHDNVPWNNDGTFCPAYDAFFKGSADVRFALHRGNREIAAAEPEDLSISYYRKTGAVLAVVANRGREARETRVSFDTAALGLAAPAFGDAESGEKLAAVDGAVAVKIPPRDFRLILATDRGTEAP